MPHNGSRVGGHAYVNGSFGGRELVNRMDSGHGFGSEIGSYDVSAYLDDNGFLVTPPPGAGNCWMTNNLWVYGSAGQIWVFTWTGTCAPRVDLWGGDFNGPGSWREALPSELPPGAPPAGPNRKYYIIVGASAAGRYDLVDPNFKLTVAGKSGLGGWGYLVRVWLRNQTTPIGNFKFYRYEDEARAQSGERFAPEWEMAAAGMGALRFMDMTQAMNFPGIADWGQFQDNPALLPCVSKYKTRATVTLLGENHYEFPVRSDAPTASEGLVLSFGYPAGNKPSYVEATMYKTGSTSPAGVVPAGKTYFVVNRKLRAVSDFNSEVAPGSPNHGWSPGDPVQQISNNRWDTDKQWGIPFKSGGISCRTNIGVVNATTFSIDWDSTAEAVSPRQVTFCRALRVKYGTQTFFVNFRNDYWAKQATWDGYSPLWAFEEPGGINGQLLTPVGREFGETWTALCFSGSGGAGQIDFHPSTYTTLCNRIQCHAWLCISPFIREETLNRLCDFWLDNADPNLNLFLELSNEQGWNYNSHSTYWNWQAQNGQFTKVNGQTVTGSWWGEAQAYHVRRLFKAAKARFTARGAGHRVKGVYATQWANFGGYTGVLDPGQPNDRWWPVGDRPLDYTDAISVAVYYAPPWHYMPNGNLNSPEWFLGQQYNKGRLSSVQFPGLLQAVWKWKQGGALREEAYDFMRDWTIGKYAELAQINAARDPAAIPWAGYAQAVNDFFDVGYPVSGGAYQSGSLSATGIWGAKMSQLSTLKGGPLEMWLYEWNNDFFPSASSEGWPNIFGDGPPSAALLNSVFQKDFAYTIPPDGYYDRVNKNYYRATNSGWQLLVQNVECTYNGEVITRKDYANFWMQYMWSQQRGDESRVFTERYFAANTANKWPHAFILNSSGNYRQSFTFWPTRTLDAFSYGTPPAVLEYLNAASGGISATLTGRGFLTARAAGTITRTAAAAGRGILSATGTKSAQQVFSGLSDYAENAVLDFLLRATGSSPTTVYLALHTGTTSENGTTNEVSTSTGYARQAITFNAPSGGQIVSAAQVAFGPFSSAPGTVVSFSIWTASSGGNCLATGQFTSSATPQVGYSLNVPAGGIQITAN